MDQIFVDGVRHPVTRVKAGPCVVTQLRGSKAQIGLGERKLKNTTKPMQGHLKSFIKENKAPRYLQEIKVQEGDLKVGDTIKASDIFLAKDTVSVTGTSKGKGFAGGVKRWGFAGGPRTHGQSDRLRAPGSIGQGTTPGRVLKGKHMAGRMGNETKTIKNLEVLGVDTETNEILISGPVPGSVGGLITVRRLNTREENPVPEVGEEKVETTPIEEVKEEVAAEEPKEETQDEQEELKEEPKEEENA